MTFGACHLQCLHLAHSPHNKLNRIKLLCSYLNILSSPVIFVVKQTLNLVPAASVMTRRWFKVYFCVSVTTKERMWRIPRWRQHISSGRCRFVLTCLPLQKTHTCSVRRVLQTAILQDATHQHVTHTRTHTEAPAQVIIHTHWVLTYFPHTFVQLCYRHTVTCTHIHIQTHKCMFTLTVTHVRPAQVFCGVKSYFTVSVWFMLHTVCHRPNHHSHRLMDSRTLRCILRKMFEG